MTAKEMFEALGYKKYLNKYDKQHKKEYGYEVYFRYKSDYIEVLFDCIDRDYSIWGNMFDRKMIPTISVELHKAINQQCKELGWLE